MSSLMKETERVRFNYISGEDVSEEDVRQALNFDIKNYVKEKYKIDIEFKNEEHHKDKNNKNIFFDSKYGNFIIEYKKPKVTIDSEVRSQLINYLHSLKDKKYNWGIVTNGLKVEIYVFSPEENDYIQLWKDEKHFSDDLTEDKFRYICDVLANRKNLILTENNINDYLGIENNKSIIRTIYKLLSNSTNERTALLYSEWQKLFNLSEQHDKFDKDKKREVTKFYSELLGQDIDTIDKQYKALFSIQTYYSIMLKLVLYKIIIGERNIELENIDGYRKLFRNLESNNFYREHNIVNLIDGDFFSWYLNEFADEEFKYFYEKIVDIKTISYGKINMLFIKFYENIFPFWVRHSMGEYYTPDYLAEDVINNAIFLVKNKDKKLQFLDPTCGSGIFILKSLEYLRKNNIEGQVYGVDINPLAVLTSKINYFINNQNPTEPLEIPIYLGDATYFPELIEVNGIKSYKYQLITSIHDYQIIDFVFSEDIIQHKNFFQILDELEMFVKMKNKTKCIQCIESYDEFHYTELKEHYDGLIDTLIDLEKRNLNSIWLKIIGNYLKTGTLRNIDCICGNPPWVRWSNLPDTYKLLIKNNCRVDGIFSGDTNVGGVDLNIAALIAFITIRERLNKNGALGFIMPDAILFNKSFEGFRKMQISDNEKYYLNKVIRWNNKSEKPFDPVTLDFAEYFFSYNKPNKIEVYDRKTSEDKVAYQNPKSFNNHYIISNEKDFEKINGILGKNNYKFHSGVGLVKGGFYLLKFKQTIDDKHSEFYIYQSNGGKKLKPSEKNIVIENEIVYPYIKTDIVNDNIITETDCFCIYPYPYGSKEPYSKKELREKFPKFYNYFISKEVQDAIDSASDYNKRVQKTEFDVGIFRVGEYSYSDWFVITRDNTKSVFAIVNKVKTPWGEDKLPIFDGHINFLSRNEDNSPITEEQANKLFNIFIQEGVKLYIKNSSDARSISSRLYNDIKVN